MVSAYNKKEDAEKLALMDHAAQWLSLKPELLVNVSSDRQLISRIDTFADAIDSYLKDKGYLPPRL